MSKAFVIAVIDLIAAVCFILALRGLSGPKTARLGNQIGAGGMVVAVLAAFFVSGATNFPLMIGSIAVGTVLGVPAARRVPMTAMPQMVALFNGVGGGAAALVSIEEFRSRAAVDSLTFGVTLAVLLSAIIGCVSFAGSGITFAKLQELMSGRPFAPPWLRYVFGGLVAVLLVLVVVILATESVAALIVLALLALVFGVLFVLPVGGADVPIVISLLNAFTGLAVAASGAVLSNVLLIVAGTLVGASGTLLTQMMGRAMGRSIPSILFGAFKGSTAGSTEISKDVRPVKSGNAEDIAIMLAYSQKVTIVPGYGLAVAQGQHTVRELADLLASKGVDVSFAIHPVAGRMPGHMNVLLAEANVPYEKLREMDDINPEFPRTDVVLVIGANDVVNPAAKTDPGSPIYGMPILNVDESKNIIFMKRSMRPGFAGIDNELLYNPKTTMLFGDAKDSLTKLISAVKAA
jgi:H+-translocating NAD(P) transhydrogenase subunit beta